MYAEKYANSELGSAVGSRVCISSEKKYEECDRIFTNEAANAENTRRRSDTNNHAKDGETKK